LLLNNSHRHFSHLFYVVIISILIFTLLTRSIYHITNLRYSEEIKPILSYLESRKDDKDIVYVYSGARPALKYYKRYFKLNNIEFIYGKHSEEKI